MTTQQPTGVSLEKGSRITGAQREAVAAHLAERYRVGESIRSMATSMGRSYGWVQTLLKEAGVELRRRGGDTRSAEAAPASRAETRRTAHASRMNDIVRAESSPAVLTTPAEQDAPKPSKQETSAKKSGKKSGKKDKESAKKAKSGSDKKKSKKDKGKLADDKKKSAKKSKKK